MSCIASIIVQAYNHERTIEQCLRSLFANADPLKCEIIIHDDASTDRTREVISSVVDAWGGEITLIYPEENRLSRGHFFIEEILHQCRGEVIFWIEGDDFWWAESENRVERMSQALLENDKYAMVFTDTVKVDSQNGKVSRLLPEALKTELSQRQLAHLEYAFLNVGACCFRNKKIVFPHEFFASTCKDLWLPMLWSEHGAARYVDDGGVLVYQYHGEGTWSGRSPEDRQVIKAIFATQIMAYFLRRGLLDAIPKHLWRLEGLKSLSNQNLAAFPKKLDLTGHAICSLD